MRTYLLLAFCLLMFAACDSRPNKTVDWEIVLDFPNTVFEVGSNTLQKEIPMSAADFAKANGMASERTAIQEITLTSCELMIEGEGDFAPVETTILQLSSKDAPMKQLAIGENKEAGKSIALKLAKDVNATDYFYYSEKIIAVLELDTNEDKLTGTPCNVKVKMKFKFTSKENTK